MEWIKANIYTTNEGIEPICGMLMEAGINGMQIEDDEDMKHFLETNEEQWDYIDEELLGADHGETKVVFYVSNNPFGNEQIVGVKDGITRLQSIDTGLNLGRLFLELINVDDEDWINNWKKYYKPFEVGEKILIKPVWEEYENHKSKIIFTINPGHVFGTGLHQTTQLCIIELEKYVNKNTRLMDIGCGSGILSIVSLLLGAQEACAIDIDPNAKDIAYENAALNGIDKEKYTVLSGNILGDKSLQEKIGNGSYDIVTANIVADVIISFSKFIPLCLKQGGIFISSGIIRERLDEVKATIEDNGFEIKDILYKDDWVCVTAIKI